MAGFRAYSFELPKSGEITLNADESHHLIRVRRAREGDRVEVIDGAGSLAAARITRADGRAAVLEIDSIKNEPPSPWHLTLAQALPKGKTMDAVVQRATELGVDRIVPLFSTQSEVELDARRAAQKQEKWRQTALESAKQCGNPWLPQIAAPSTLEDFFPVANEATHRLVAALTPDTTTVRSALGADDQPRNVVLLVGPEGDFSPPEYHLIFSSGFVPVSLGPRVLRVETAACSLIALSLEALRETTAERQNGRK